MPTLKVYFVSHGASSYGAERSLAEIVLEALRRRHEVTVFLPGPGPLQDLLMRRGVPPAAIREQSNRRWLAPSGAGQGLIGTHARLVVDVRRFLRVFRRGRPDVVVVNSAVAPAAAFAGRAAGLPVVTFVREAIRTNPQLESALPKPVIVRLIRAVSSTVVCNSRFVAGQVGGGCEVVYPPVSVFQRDCVAPARARGPLRLIMFGRFTAEKGQRDLVQAVLRARDAGHDVEADCYGDDAIDPGYTGSLLKLLEGSAHRHAVRLHPFADDLATLYDSAHLSVVASPSEAFGRVTVESLQCGVPVIGYDTGGTREILQRGGGLLVAPSAEGLYEALVELSRSPALLERLRAEAVAAGEQWRATRPAEAAVEIIERTAAQALHSPFAPTRRTRGRAC